MALFELVFALTLTVGPPVGVPLHDTRLHVLVDSVLGVVVGVVLVALYIAALRRADSGRDGDDDAAEPPTQGRQSGNP
jgi:NhaP-type Na+/H+ or K+/H+ antiporter